MAGLDGKIALVTGVGRKHGIGRGIAKRLAEEGADLIVNDIGNQEADGWGGMPEVVCEIEAMGRRAIGVLADVSDSAQVSDMVSQTLDVFGRIDVLVNNAGSPVGPDRVPVVDLEESQWDLVQRCNAKGTFLCSQKVARHMLDRGEGGRIINIASIAGKRGGARSAAYSASKFAIIGLTQAMALEVAPHGITVNVICPGTIFNERSADIAMTGAPQGTSRDEASEAFARGAAASIPVRRVGNAADVAAVVSFLVSKEADFLTGASIPVTGGQVMW